MRGERPTPKKASAFFYEKNPSSRVKHSALDEKN